MGVANGFEAARGLFQGFLPARLAEMRERVGGVEIGMYASLGASSLRINGLVSLCGCFT